MFHLLLLCLLVNGDPREQIGLLRPAPTGGRQASFELFIHGATDDSLDALGRITDSDLSFHEPKGKHPLRHSFAVDWDGDGRDEIAVVLERKRQQHRLELRIYRPPTTVGGQTGKPVASSKGNSLGRATGNGRIIALGSIDLDGDQRDELMLVREWSDRSQSLEVRALPPGKRTRVGPLLVSDLSFGMTGSDAVISAFGTDRDGDGRDEIVSLRRDSAGPDRLPDRLLVHRAPTTVGGETGAPIASDTDVTPFGSKNINIARTDLEGDGVDEVVFLHHYALSFEHRWAAVYRLPTRIDDDLGDALLWDMSLNGIQSDDTTCSVLGLQTAAYAPALTGTYELWVLVTFDGFEGAVPGSAEWIGPFSGLLGTQTTGQFEMRYPDGTLVSGPIELAGLVQSVRFAPTVVTLSAVVNSPGGFINAGDQLEFTHSSFWFEEDGGELIHEGRSGTVFRPVPGSADLYIGDIDRVRFVRTGP